MVWPEYSRCDRRIESAGFSVTHLASWASASRSAFKATVTDVPSRLIDGTYEGLSTLNAHLTGIRRDDAPLFRRD
jgi:hypothetical protein